MFWKEAWLKPVGAAGSRQTRELLTDKSPCSRYVPAAASTGDSNSCGNHVSWAGQRCQILVPGHPVDGIHHSPCSGGTPRQYVEAYRSGNYSLSTVLKSIVYLIYYYGTMARSPRLGAVASAAATSSSLSGEAFRFQGSLEKLRRAEPSQARSEI